KTTLQSPGGIESELDRLLAEAGLHLKAHLASHLSGPQRYSALMSANAIRLARGGLRLTQPNLVASIANDSEKTMLAKKELAADLAVWNFRG
ncbi:MAG: hypothetical protein EBS50_11790, partial [Sphingomonadaceae bacterium]|nr:hypothetical protein [Sphingomonadaceae bacterium]